MIYKFRTPKEELGLGEKKESGIDLALNCYGIIDFDVITYERLTFYLSVL